MGSTYRNYYGLPVSILAEDRDFVLGEAKIAKDDPPIDVGARALSIKVLYDSPYWEIVLFQNENPVAVVHCVMNQNGLIEGLRTDDAATIRRVFDIYKRRSENRPVNAA
jgi:hypothetical protein